MNKIDYDEYIQSDEWKKKEKEFIEMRGKCQDCGSTKRLGCHHPGYEYLGHELLCDVEVLCWPCHQKRHPERVRRKLKITIEEQIKRFAKECRWRQIIPTLPENFRKRFEPKEELIVLEKPKEELIVLEKPLKEKIKLKDYPKHIHVSWIKKIKDIIKSISKIFYGIPK